MTDTDENTDDSSAQEHKPDDLRSRLENLRRRASGEDRPSTKSASPAGDDHRASKSAPSSAESRRPSGRHQPPIVYRRDLPRRPSTGQEIGRPRSRTVVLEETVDGAEERHPERGPAYVVRTRVDQVEGAEPCSRAFRQVLIRGEATLHPRLALLCDPRKLVPEDVVFVDLETAGLGTAPLFLIGAMTWVDGGLEVQQYLARNYAEEAAAIALFVDHHATRKLLVTFNGKSFDFPFIRTRAAANGIPFSWQPGHFDLLHACRRVWKGVLPDCKLQTLETFVCRRPRHGDIPGSQIPEAYHAYVRTANASQIVEVLKHNMLDLITLADLMTRFPGA